MQIEITEEEYGKLLDLLSIANSVLTGHKGQDPRTEEYVQLIQKLYALAKETDQGGKIAYDRELGRYVPVKKFEESSDAQSFLDEYTDEVFWHELIYRLTERDVERQAGGYEKTLTMTPEERFDLETPVEEKYLEEFEKHGIERLEIVEHFGIGGPSTRTSD